MKALIKQYKNLIALITIIVGLLIVFSNTYVIPTGYTGVLVRFGQIDERPVQIGRLTFTTPFVEHIYKVNNKQQDFTVHNEVWGETSDKTPIYAKGITVTYQISAERSTWIYANVSDYANSLLTERLVTSAVKAAIVELTPSEVTNRAKIEPLVLTKLNDSLVSKYGMDTVNVCKVIISDMDFEHEYNSAIRDKSIAAQEHAKAEIENQTAISKARAKREIAMLEAQAQAERVKIVAEAEAEANRLIHESLTPELIEIRKIEAWDGRLPTVTGENFVPFLEIKPDVDSR